MRSSVPCIIYFVYESYCLSQVAFIAFAVLSLVTCSNGPVYTHNSVDISPVGVHSAVHSAVLTAVLTRLGGRCCRLPLLGLLSKPW